MALVDLSVLYTVFGGHSPVTRGTVTVLYVVGTRPFTDLEGVEVRFSTPMVLPITGDPLVADLAPTRGRCAAKVVIEDHVSGRTLIRHVEIPDVPTISFGELVDVDPATFQPSQEGQAAWDAAVAAANTALQGAVAAQSAAVESAGAADESARAALEASELAVPAASSAVAAATDAALARDDAQRAAADLSGAVGDVDGLKALTTTGRLSDPELSDKIEAETVGKANAARISSLPSAASGAERVYDGVRNVYNLQSAALLKLRSAIGKAIGGTGYAKIACVGTSIAAGQGALAGSTSYPVRLRQLISAAGVPVGGTGIVLCHQGDTPADTRWAFPSGPWAKFNPGATDRTMLYYSNASGAQAVFTSDLPGTVVDVFYSNSSSPFTVTIDGGSAVTVTPTGSTSIGTYTVTGLTDTTHTVTVSRVSGTVYLSGAQVRRTSGLLVSNIGLGGARVSDLNFAVQPYVTAPYVRDLIKPDLIVFNAMTNEAYTGVAASTFKTNLTALLTAWKSAGVSMLLVAEIPAGGTTSGGAAMDLATYRVALYEVAVGLDLPVVDLYERWGSYAAANTAGLMADVFHPNAAGYADYARALASALS